MFPWNPLSTKEQVAVVQSVMTDDEAFAAPLAEEESERASLSAYRRARRRARTRRLGIGLLGLAALAVTWQVIAVIINDPVYLPSVTQTVSTFAHYLGRPYPAQGTPLWLDTLTSLRRILVGFAAGAVLGVALGAAMAASTVARYLVDP